MSDGHHDVTRLLARVRQSDPRASTELFELLYAELRALAGAAMQREGSGHTLQPTALVHEAWMRLADPAALEVRDRAHFFALAARAMRHILTDHARRRLAERRGGGRALVEVGEDLRDPTRVFDGIDLLALDEALTKLGTESEQAARVVELLFFAGLTGEEAADALGVSPRTVDREWRFARAWLLHALRGESA